MGIIRRDDARDVAPLNLGAPRGLPASRVFRFEDVTPRSPQTAAPPTAAAPASSSTPPVVEVPEELLHALYEDVVLRGREEGLAHAESSLQAEMKALQERYAGALERLDSVSRQLVDRNRMYVIRLACRVAEKLVRHHLSTHPDHLLNLVREAMAELEERDEVVVRCSQDDYTYLAARCADLGLGMGGRFRVQLVSDPELTAGDFRVEARSGAVDGRVSTRLADAEGTMLAPDGEGPDAP